MKPVGPEKSLDRADTPGSVVAITPTPVTGDVERGPAVTPEVDRGVGPSAATDSSAGSTVRREESGDTGGLLHRQTRCGASFFARASR